MASVTSWWRYVIELHVRGNHCWVREHSRGEGKSRYTHRKAEWFRGHWVVDHSLYAHAYGRFLRYVDVVEQNEQELVGGSFAKYDGVRLMESTPSGLMELTRWQR